MKILRRSIYTIDVGEMRNLITLMPSVLTEDAYGNTAVTYPVEDQFEVYALVHPGGNQRSLQEANLTYDNIITVYLRYDANLKNTWKIGYDGYDYTIHKSSNVDAKNRFIQLLCYAKNP